MRVEVPEELLPADRLSRVHFVGIGGAGLSGIARLMHQSGVPVSGSDANDSAVVRALAGEGIDVHVGHDPAHLDGVDTVVATTAVREDNPEIVAALERIAWWDWPHERLREGLQDFRRMEAAAFCRKYDLS